MLRVFHDLGLRVTRHFDGPEVHCTVELTQDETHLSAVESRGRLVGIAGLQPLLRPGTVAVIGAGRTPGSVGRAILRTIRNGSRTGRLYAVHPRTPPAPWPTPRPVRTGSPDCPAPFRSYRTSRPAARRN